MKRVLGGEKPGAKASSSGDKERKSRDSSADKRKRRDKEVSHLPDQGLITLSERECENLASKLKLKHLFSWHLIAIDIIKL